MTTLTDTAAPLGEDDQPAAPAAPMLEPAQCAVATCADIVSGKWTLLILRDLASGAKFYSDLESSLAGISPRTLCDRLKSLGAHGLVSHTRIKALPPRSIYELTERGSQLVPVIETMRAAGEALLASPIDAESAADMGCGATPCE